MFSGFTGLKQGVHIGQTVENRCSSGLESKDLVKTEKGKEILV